MSVREKPNQHLLSLFHEQSCWMIEPLAAEMKYSIPSVRRFLAEVGYFSSFTHNGSWYTLRSIPHFDGDGLWFYRDIGFSRSGSLTKTLIDLVVRSPTGMTAETLGAKLRVRCHAGLVQLCRKGKLQRQKMGRSHVYYSVDSTIAAASRVLRTIVGPETGDQFSQLPTLAPIESLGLHERGCQRYELSITVFVRKILQLPLQVSLLRHRRRIAVRPLVSTAIDVALAHHSLKQFQHRRGFGVGAIAVNRLRQFTNRCRFVQPKLPQQHHFRHRQTFHEHLAIHMSQTVGLV